MVSYIHYYVVCSQFFYMTKMEGGLGGNKGNENVDLTKLSPAEIQKIIDDAKKQMAELEAPPF